jgi:hypothetical protein
VRRALPALAILTAFLLFFAGGCSCGTDCGPGTVEVGGACVPACGPGTVAGPAGCVAVERPADGRPCDARYGPVTEADEGALFVDASFSGSSDGSFARPFREIADAIAAAGDGDVIGVAAGTYAGFAVERPLTLEGRCARDVVVEGTISVRDTGDVAIRGFTVTGGDPGIEAMNVQPIDGETGLELRYVRLTMNTGAGLVLDASEVAFLESEVALTAARVNDETALGLGSGIVVLGGSDLTASLGFVAMNDLIGVDVVDFTGDLFATSGTSPSRVLLDSTEVRANLGAGVRVGYQPEANCDALIAGDRPAPVTIRASDVCWNAGAGVEATCRSVAVVASAVFDNGGGGILATRSPGVSVSGSLVSGNHGHGIRLDDVPDAAIHGNVVADTLAGDGSGGHGIYVSADVAAAIGPLFASIRDNDVIENAGAGISVDGGFDSAAAVTTHAEATDDEDLLYAVSDNYLRGNGFYAINVQLSLGGEVARNYVESATGYGLRVLEVASPDLDGAEPLFTPRTRLLVRGNTILEVGRSGAPTDIDGDCLLLHASNVELDGNVLDGCARYGIAATGGCTGRSVGESGESVGDVGAHPRTNCGNDIIEIDIDKAGECPDRDTTPFR